MAKITQTSQASWVNTFINLGTAYKRVRFVSLYHPSTNLGKRLRLIFRRRLIDARDTYRRVIEIDPRNVPALVSLGSVYQLLDDPDRAIVKYHEVFGTTEFLSALGSVNRVF